MTTETPTTHEVLANLRFQAGLVEAVVRMNLQDVGHEESLRTPSPAGNCINWVLGHLLDTYDATLPMLGQEPVMEKGALARYARGSEPLADPAEALDLAALRDAWDEAAARVAVGIESLPPEALDRPAPFSPGNDPDETVRSLLTTVLFHQTYHAGQLGLLRRLAGKPGAIR